jgi:hypothetical protein
MNVELKKIITYIDLYKNKWKPLRSTLNNTLKNNYVKYGLFVYWWWISVSIDLRETLLC